MDCKVKVKAAFRIWVSQGEGEPERKEEYSVGQSVTVPQETADLWVDHGLVEVVPDGPSFKRPALDQSADAIGA
jgi:hypothetical protein